MYQPLRTSLVVALALTLLAVPAIAGSTGADVRVADVDYTGDGEIDTAVSVVGVVLYRSDRHLGETTSRRRSTGQTEQFGGEDGSDSAAASDDLHTEFLSNEECIRRLLEANDGRIRQAAIVDRTGWSKSKVSRVLSAMSEDGQVVKIDVRSGNVVTFPDRVPRAAESPFED